MRGVLLSLAAAFVLVSAVPTRAHAASASGTAAIAPQATVLYALQQPSAPKEIDINVTHSGGGRWYANPVWIGLGVLAVVVILLLVVLAARGGGGTTIVKD